MGWGGVGCNNVPCAASTSWSAWGGGGGVGWGAITFLALHPRLGQHGRVEGGVGWGAIKFLSLHVLVSMGGVEGWGGLAAGLLQAAGRFLGAIISHKKNSSKYIKVHMRMVRIP